MTTVPCFKDREMYALETNGVLANLQARFGLLKVSSTRALKWYCQQTRQDLHPIQLLTE